MTSFECVSRQTIELVIKGIKKKMLNLGILRGLHISILTLSKDVFVRANLVSLIHFSGFIICLRERISAIACIIQEDFT